MSRRRVSLRPSDERGKPWRENSMEIRMHRYCLRRVAVLVALVVGFSPLFVKVSQGTAPPAAGAATYKGKVVPLAGVLEKEFGSRLEKEAAPHWLALVAENGKFYPLIPDDGSRLFFRDSRLLNRPMQVTGRLFPDTHLLQVLSVNSIVKGELCEVYYWCEVCSIRRNEKMERCECCGGPMELREVPVKK
jgi:hypothetical protein